MPNIPTACPPRSWRLPFPAIALALLFGCGANRTGAADVEAEKTVKALAVVAQHMASLPEEERLRVAGYSTTKAATTPSVYRNTMHGYQVTVPPGVELQEHRNGQFVIAPGHGTLFAIWTHAEDPTAHVEAKLLKECERWCGEYPASAKERSSNGGSLRLVPITKQGFTGYKAIARNLPDTAPARFYLFKSTLRDGYFGFNLPPSLATALFDSLQPLPAATPAEPPRGR